MSMVVGAKLYNGDGDIFLGDLLPASASIDSVCDSSGAYGSDISITSIRNPNGDYGNTHGNESAFSMFANNPPVVMLDQQQLGRLSVSPFLLDAINPYDVLEALGCLPEPEED